MNSQVVLISGCSSGIGLVTAVVLAKDPEKRFKVYATMRNLAKKGQLEEEGRQHLGDTLIIKQMDVCSDESVNKAVEEVLNKEGRIDVLLNNAGTALISPVECSSITRAQEVFDINFFGPLRLIKAVVPSMKERQRGHIINTTGLISLVAVPFVAINAASKFAVEGLTESISPTLRQFNIRCTLLEPGFVMTAAYHREKDLVQAFTPEYSTADPKTKQLMERVQRELQRSASKTTVTAEMVGEFIKEIILGKESNFRCQTRSDFLAEEIASKLADLTGNNALEAITKRFFGSEN